MSPLVRTVVNELDGARRLKVLLAITLNAAKQKGLRRWALELQKLSFTPRRVHQSDVRRWSHVNYLAYLFAELKSQAPKTADGLAKIVARQGVSVGPASGHFLSLDHLDPRAPLPGTPPNASVRNVPFSRWIDDFVWPPKYDVGYRPKTSGALSEFLQLTYKDRVVVDVDLHAISANRDDAWAHSLAWMSLGAGGRLVPLRLSQNLTPKLWKAKLYALASMGRSNSDFSTFTSIATAGVMVNLPFGPVVGARPGTSSTRGRGTTRPAITTRLRTSGLDEQVTILVRRIPGLEPQQARRLLTAAFKRNSSAVFGGSRVRGNHHPGSDLDVGFGHLTPRQTQRLIKRLNRAGDALTLEHNIAIAPGGKTKTVRTIRTPEEFFQRSGIRAGRDPRAGQRYTPSGSITALPNGEVIIIPPGAN